MKHNFKTTIGTITIVALLIISACSKGGDSANTPTASKTTLLTSSDWGIVGVQQKVVSASVWTDNYASMKACEKDNRVIFKANGSYETNEGATKCSASDPQILESGTWSLTQNETMLVIQATNSSQIMNATIETLTTSSLIFSYTQVISGVTYQYRESFGH
ncbi:MAG: DUF5004 domain-containing protein [Bacteroidetes bacterium]|nr:DUF5004 domain-containing protein [Bacteroidota bacterium]